MVSNSDLFSSMQLSYWPLGNWKFFINLTTILDTVSEEYTKCTYVDKQHAKSHFHYNFHAKVKTLSVAVVFRCTLCFTPF